MRYIGNKENILETIYSIFCKNNVQGKTFFEQLYILEISHFIDFF